MKHQAVVIGSGPVGATIARRPAERDVSVLLLWGRQGSDFTAGQSPA
jgi:choline dehydrogenase-like flavoprotein